LLSSKDMQKNTNYRVGWFDVFCRENDLPKNSLKQQINLLLKEDGASNDVTSNLTIGKKVLVNFEIVFKQKNDENIKQNYILCGCDIAKHIISCRGGGVVRSFLMDGSLVKQGDVVLSGVCNARNLLALERIILNIIQQLSGVATKTRAVQNIVDAECTSKNISNTIKILDTRKTLLNARLFQRYAVFVGGGQNHRYNLSSKILIKDNHIEANGGIENIIKILQKAKSKTKNTEIEIECDTPEQIDVVLQNCHLFNTIMLDNFSPQQVQTFALQIKQCSNLKVEVSGGITPTNIANYCHQGVDHISLGYLTHSVNSLDFGLDVKFI